jgi:hypothetical protein
VDKLTIRDLELGGKRVLVRVDFNVPVDEAGNITDDTRIKAALPTIKYISDHQGKVLLASHFGRPKGRVVDEFRLDTVAKRLGELLGRKVPKLDDCVGQEVKQAVDRMQPGDILLLENVRFYPEEEKNDPSFAKALAANADIFVSIHNDSFTSPTAAGTTTFHYGDAESIKLATFVQKSLVDGLGTKDRGARYASFYVIRYTDMPAILVEVAFISNPEEEMLLASVDGRYKAADSIFRGIVKYFKV